MRQIAEGNVELTRELPSVAADIERAAPAGEDGAEPLPLRRLGGINFLLLRDGYGLFQAVIDDPDVLAALRNVQPESVIEVEGTVVSEPQAPEGLELHGCRVRVLTPVTETMPFELNKKVLRPGLDVFLDHAARGGVGIKRTKQVSPSAARDRAMPPVASPSDGSACAAARLEPCTARYGVRPAAGGTCVLCQLVPVGGDTRRLDRRYNGVWRRIRPNM